MSNQSTMPQTQYQTTESQQQYTSLTTNIIQRQLRDLSHQNEQIYQSSAHLNSQSHNQQILNELDVIKSQVQDVKNELKSIDRLSHNSSSRLSVGVQQSNRKSQPRRSFNPQQPIFSSTGKMQSLNQTTTNSFVHQKRNQQTLNNLSIASACSHSQRVRTQEAMCQYYQQRSSVLLYIPLNRLFNSQYLRQSQHNGLQLYQVDKRGKIGAPKIYNFQNTIQTDPESLINIAFEDQSINLTLVFHCMKGSQKKYILKLLLQKLEAIVAPAQMMEIQIQEFVYLEQESGIEGIIKNIWSECTDDVNFVTDLQDLIYELERKKIKYKALKSIIRDQILYQRKKNWIIAKQNLRKNFAISIIFQFKVESTVFVKRHCFIFSNGKEQNDKKYVISNQNDYINLLKQIHTYDNKQVHIYALNPQQKYHEEIEDYLKLAKKKEKI